jgi:hypothetical protein
MMIMRFMRYLQDIVEIENRAKAVNLKIGVLCTRAGVCYRSWWRWRRGRNTPNMTKWSVAITALHAELAAEEARIRAALSVAA